MNRHFSNDVQMANNHMKRCSTLLFIREMQIKTTVRYYFIPTRRAIIKYTHVEKTTGVGEDVEKLEPCALLVGKQSGELLWKIVSSKN